MWMKARFPAHTEATALMILDPPVLSLCIVLPPLERLFSGAVINRSYRIDVQRTGLGSLSRAVFGKRGPPVTGKAKQDPVSSRLDRRRGAGVRRNRESAIPGPFPLSGLDSEGWKVSQGRCLREKSPPFSRG